MDRLDAMRIFVRVAELGSFSAVAQQMGVARSVVTRQVAALEQHLGCQLMARSTRRLTLTSAGTGYLEKCRVILNLVEAAETDIAAAEASGPAETIARFLAVSVNTRPFNYLGLPAVSLPCGFDGNGLPVGLQLAGRPFAEARVLKVADGYQRETDWHRRKPAGI